MKAVLCVKHGEPGGLQIREIAGPGLEEDEILIRIKATTVTAGDVILRKQSFLQWLLMWPISRCVFGIKNQRKKILGHEFSGVVEEVGQAVSRFHKGDAVFGTTGFGGGAHAEYISMSEYGILAQKPDNLSFEAAAALPIGGTCALHFLRKARVKAGDAVLIYGASGSIGTYAVQLAKYFGAHVTGVCSTRNIELVKSLGADAVLDYTKYDITQMAERYQVIFDTVGKLSKSKARNILVDDGRYVSTHTSPVKEKQEHLDLICDLAAKGKIKPVIDQSYTLASIQTAHTYVETGHKQGNVIITI